MSSPNIASFPGHSCFFGMAFSRLQPNVQGCLALVLGLIFSPNVFSLDPSEVFLRASPSVVIVMGVKKSQEGSLGSGVAIRANTVATNCHVIDAANRLFVQHSDKLLRASVFARDDDRDVCLLKIDHGKLSPAVIAEAGKIQPGNRVYAIGSPRGLEKTISEGLISGIRWTENGHIIQTSAAISKGSSGGGLFDSNGGLVGFTTFFYSDSQNLNFAIPASAAENLLNDVDRRSDGNIADANNNSLADSVLTALSAEPPVPEFSSMAKRLEYLRWLAYADDRLKNTIIDSQTRTEFLQTAWYESFRSGLDVGLILGLIETSSEFRKFAIHESGARGYMQVATSWSAKIGDGDNVKLFSTQVNLRYGCVILRHYMDISGGDARYALIRYYAQISGRSYRLKDREALNFSRVVLKAQRNWGIQ